MIKKSIVFSGLLAFLPSVASADILTVSAAAKGLTTGGTGYLAEKWDAPLGAGAELGVELFGLDILGEAYLFGADQYQFSGNLGIDFDLGGDDIRVTPGIFGGALIYVLPEPSTPSGFDPSTLPPDVQSTIGVDNLAKISTEYQSIAKKEEAANRTLTALTARARLTIEYKLLPLIYLGAEGDAGLHYLVSGEAASTNAKKKMIRQQKAENPDVPAAAYDSLGDAIGANKSTDINRTGMNFSAGVFVKVEI